MSKHIVESISKYNNWEVSKKFNSKGKVVIVDGRKYELVEKRELKFSNLKLYARRFFATIAIICFLALLLFPKKIINFLSKKKDTIYLRKVVKEQSQSQTVIQKLVEKKEPVIAIPVKGPEKLDPKIESFQQNPTWEKYSQLPNDFQYLVAGRYYYQMSGWTFTSKLTLMKKFEDDYNGKDFSAAPKSLNKAIDEAVQLHIKIQKLKNLKSENRADKLKELDSETYLQIKSCMQRNLTDEQTRQKDNQAIETETEIANKVNEMLTNNPNAPLVNDQLDRLIHHFEGAYPCNETHGYPFMN